MGGWRRSMIVVSAGLAFSLAVLPSVMRERPAAEGGPGAWGSGALAATKEQRKAAREKRQKSPKPAPLAPLPAPRPAPAEPTPAPEPPPAPPERVEADVSTRSVAVTSAFQGTQIVVFGSVDNSRQPSAESGYYDVVVIVEGQPAKVTIRRKSNVAGLWVNTAAAAFEAVPSYYAIASTRPLEEIAHADLLRDLVIGFENVRFKSAPSVLAGHLATEIRDYQDAVMRLKEDEGLFVRADTGVAFIGRSLFRSSIELPANIPVSSLTARVYLFREGELLSRYTTQVKLERKGLELHLYDFAHEHSLFYGLAAVMMALACGFAASAIFSRGPR